MKSLTLKIAIANITSSGVVYLGLEIHDHIPGWLVYVLYPFYLYFSLSIFFTVGGLILGILEYKSLNHKLMTIISFLLNIVYLIGFIMFLRYIWDGLMSV